ncbi:MAG: hypothetical protein FJ271_24965 [Planctomycetes bacterium]|nr:hypothetical protein [Planctomycetota bacterium]
MRIRTFQPGDEALQASIYNRAAAALPRFKPATTQEVQRRSRARDFDPAAHFFVEQMGETVGYAHFLPNGRVSRAWTLPGHEALAGPLFAHLLSAMKERGFRKVFAAYRGDWLEVHDFLLGHGFGKARDIVNYAIDLVDMPTPPARPSSGITPLRPDDLPALFTLVPGLVQLASVADWEKHLFHNPQIPADAAFVLRSHDGNTPLAVGILVTDPNYASPGNVDANMPCYRLGAFGNELMSVKRINGLFSFLAANDAKLSPLGLDLMGHAAYRLRETDDVESLAAQAPSDADGLTWFYQRNFRRQGSFPVFERQL